MQVAEGSPPRTPVSHDRCRRSRLDVALLTLLLLPLLVLLFDPNYFVPMAGLDPWFYFGYYLHYPAFLHAFPQTYYGTRLSVILPGWLAYHTLPDLAANYLLHVGLYLIGLTCLYFVLKDVVNRRSAFLTALFLGCFSPFVSAVSWDYVDGYGIAYCFLSYALLHAGTRSSRWRLCLLGAGGAAAAMAVANTFYAVLVPFLLGFYYAAGRERQPRALAPAVGWFSLGGVLVVFTLGCVNLAAGGRFLFFLPSLQVVADLAHNNPHSAPLRTWLPRLPSATWLYLQLTVGLASLLQTAWWLARPASRPGWLRSYLHAQLPVQLLFFAALEATGRVPILQCSYYSDLLLPATFLALGDHLRGLTVVRRFHPMAVAASGLFLASLLIPTPIAATLSAMSPLLLLVLPLAGCLALLLCRAGSFAPCGWAALALLAAFNACVRDCYSLRDSLPFTAARAQARLNLGHERQAMLRTVTGAVRLLQQYDRVGNVWFWYDQKAPLYFLYDMTASTYLYNHRIVSRDFPTGNSDAVSSQLLRPGTRLAILGQTGDVLNRARLALAPRGIGVNLLYQGMVGDGPAAYPLTLLEPHALHDAPPTTGRQPEPVRATP